MKLFAVVVFLSVAMNESVFSQDFFPCNAGFQAPADLNMSACVLVDVNNDGKNDIVGVRAQGPVALLAGASGQFSVVYSTGTATGGITGSTACADFNNDGKIDIARSSYENNTPSLAKVVVNFGTGTGSFTTEVVLSIGNWATEVEVGDIDGDGDNDIICGTETTGIRVWKSNGNGTFSASATYTSGNINRQMILTDINGDNRPDLVVINETENRFSVLLNSGTGTFPTRTIYTSGNYPTGLLVADLDNDGDRDVAIAHRFTNEIRIFKNSGTGTLTAWQTIADPIGGSVGQIVSGDFDGDGDTDFTCISGYGQPHKWRNFKNTAGVFAGGATELGTANGWTVIVGKLDADLKPDLLSCENSTGTTIGTFRSFHTLCPCPGDINLNSIVDAVDLAMVLTSWGTNGTGGEFDADITNDGIVGGADITVVFSGWGPCPN